MILVDWLQVGSGDRSNYRDVEEDGPKLAGSQEGQTKEKDKTNSDRGAALKGPAVTQPITSMRRKNRGIWSVEELKGQTFGGQPKRSAVVI